MYKGSERIWKDFQLAWCICRSCDLHHPGFTSNSQGIDLHVSYYLFLNPLGCQVVIIAAFAPGLDVGFSDPQGWKSTSCVGQTPGAEWRERRLAALSTSSWQLQGDLEIFVDGFWRWSTVDVRYIEACWIYYWLVKKEWYPQKIKERMVEHVGSDWNKFLWLPAVLFILLFPSWIQWSGRSVQEIALLKTWRLFRKGVANRFLSRMPRRTCDLLMTTMMHCLWQVDFLRLSHSCHSHATLGSNAIRCINWILSAFFQVEPVWVGKTELASPWLRDWSFWWDSSRPRLHSQRFCFKAFQASLV